MRVNGRLLRPSNLAERRVMKSLGIDYLRCPRTENPYALARRIKRASKPTEDVLFVREIVERTKQVMPPTTGPAPDGDTTEDQALADGTG